MIMTPHQVLVVAALGGLAAVLGLVVFVGLALAVFRLASHLVDRYEDYRARRATAGGPPTAGSAPAAADDLATCRAIDALGTTRHHVEE